MTKWTTETHVPDFGVSRHALDVEDGGQAILFSVDNGEEEGFFVHLRSWANADARCAWNDATLPDLHPEFAKFAGKKVRVTVEVIDE